MTTRGTPLDHNTLLRLLNVIGGRREDHHVTPLTQNLLDTFKGLEESGYRLYRVDDVKELAQEAWAEGVLAQWLEDEPLYASDFLTSDYAFRDGFYHNMTKEKGLDG